MSATTLPPSGSLHPIVGLCPECGCETGHKINCKTGNDKARAYQSGLAAKHRKKRKPMFTIEQAFEWMDRHGIKCSVGTARDAMEDAANRKPNVKTLATGGAAIRSDEAEQPKKND